ncbi:MAG: AraC family transcriptional regulator [Polyangiales bacterium]
MGQHDAPQHHVHAGSVTVFRDQVARMEPHGASTHTEYGLTYMVSGWHRMEHGGPVEASAGTFTVVPAGVPHRALDGRDMDYWLLGFCPQCLGLDEGHALMSPFRRVRHGALPVLDVSDDRQPRVLTLYAELRDALAHADAATPEVTRSLVVLLLAEARRAMPGDASGSAVTSLVGDALAFIQRHGLEPISLRDVAKAVHRTPSHVANVVKQETGFSVGEWITAGRVAEAAARLAHTDDSLEEVATRVGWTDKTHLTRQFKAAYGVTPAAFRRVRRGA